MTTNARSFSAVLQDITANVQDIVRLEVRLAKTEVREEVGKATSAATFLGVGAACGLLGAAFTLLAAVYGLALVLPLWAAALVVGVVLVLVAAVTVRMGLARWRRVDPVPDRTIRNVKEQIAWSKQQLK